MNRAYDLVDDGMGTVSINRAALRPKVEQGTADIEFVQSVAKVGSTRINIRVLDCVATQEEGLAIEKAMKGWHLASAREIAIFYRNKVKEVWDVLPKDVITSTTRYADSDAHSKNSDAVKEAYLSQAYPVVSGPGRILEDGTRVPIKYNGKTYRAHKDPSNRNSVLDIFKMLPKSERAWDDHNEGPVAARCREVSRMNIPALVFFAGHAVNGVPIMVQNAQNVQQSLDQFVRMQANA
jgi:hypothetical protein